ncbi:DUF6157 family protein [Paenibacillus eucommiae]|uniref:Uncharacterized protein n=1 Tax=Paenibacillus eucommiae TaxID=1355755 RepID=A0ABS4IW61_9BACL|nr:DUF6157 family protein [Paenibacillus eucommiae]MBP1991835.1 hypothetical protein [Paenibacillus eucommiae]
MMMIKNTFIEVSTDCPVETGVVPVTKKDSKPIHLIQYELLTQAPYTYTLEDLIFEVHIKRSDSPKDNLEQIREQLFQKSHPCMRASLLPKKYGWGVHHNNEGKIAIYAMESPEYQGFLEDDKVKREYAMRSKRI